MIAMNTNAVFVGSNNSNPFHYQKFDLSEVVIYKNGMPLVDTPLSTVENVETLVLGEKHSIFFFFFRLSTP